MSFVWKGKSEAEFPPPVRLHVVRLAVANIQGGDVDVWEVDLYTSNIFQAWSPSHAESTLLDLQIGSLTLLLPCCFILLQSLLIFKEAVGLHRIVPHVNLFVLHVSFPSSPHFLVPLFSSLCFFFFSIFPGFSSPAARPVKPSSH